VQFDAKGLSSWWGKGPIFLCGYVVQEACCVGGHRAFQALLCFWRDVPRARWRTCDARHRGCTQCSIVCPASICAPRYGRSFHSSTQMFLRALAATEVRPGVGLLVSRPAWTCSPWMCRILPLVASCHPNSSGNAQVLITLSLPLDELWRCRHPPVQKSSGLLWEVSCVAHGTKQGENELKLLVVLH
jgi:hypothetical protein